MSYHGGLAAEAQVEARYLAAGKTVAARRWRGRGGEIDLIFRDGAALIFVEVKLADSHDSAACKRGKRRGLGRPRPSFWQGNPAARIPTCALTWRWLIRRAASRLSRMRCGIDCCPRRLLLAPRACPARLHLARHAAITLTKRKEGEPWR
jgi:putative endonuclease